MRLVLLLFFLNFFATVFSQSTYPVHLKSGDYLPLTIENSILSATDHFVILQFKTLPNTDEFYTKTGIKLLDYLPDNSFYAALPPDFKIEQLPREVSGILKITTAMKTDPLSWANRQVDIIKVVYFETSDLTKILQSIEQKGFEVLRFYKGFQTIYVKAKPDYTPLLEIEEIYWAEPHYQKLVENNLVERNNHRANVIGDNNSPGKGLTGQGIKIGEWDGGDVGNHEDFNYRVTVVKKVGISSHATHVCGTMAGAGNIDPLTRGMAPKAGVYSWDFNGDIPVEMDTNYPKFGYTLTQNSYAYSPADDPCVLRGNYDEISREMDLTVEKYPNLLHVFAAGNSRGSNCRSGGFKTINSGFQCAKNVLAVAAVTELDGDASFSGCGPTRDGRLKPEVSAVGVSVYSSVPNNGYGFSSGTSMACPGASGTTAMVYEYYFKKYGVLMDAHLAKNFMANSADDIGNSGPDFRYGFGRINARRAIGIIDSKAFQSDSLKQNFIDYDTLKIPKGLFKLKVMLCWNDKAAAIPAKPCLINDLDLTVMDSLGTIYKPWVLDTVSHNAVALRGRDSLNNIEQVTIDNPPSGKLIILVKGKRVTTAFQNYSLTWDMVNTGIAVTYPNGQESFPPPSSAGVAQTIRWDAYNLTGNAKIEYSGNKGTTWQTVVSSVPVSQKYFVWVNASDTINTNRALIKITAGTFVDQSDTTFTIYKIPTVLVGVICDSQVHFRWPKQNGAVAYKLYQLKAGEMQTIYSGTDTFFTVKPLNNGQAYWFSLNSISKTGGESQRMVAKSFTPASTIKPPKITLDLYDTAGCKNTNMVLKSTVTGTAAITNFWQRSTNKGSNWNTLTGRISDTLVLQNIKYSQNDWRYRRVSYNACEGKVYSYPAKVEVDTSLPSFSIPTDTIGCTGGDIGLSIYNLKSVSKPWIEWMAVCKFSGSTGTIKKSKELNLQLTNLSGVDSKNYPVKVTNSCGTYCAKTGCCGTLLKVVPKLSLDLKDNDTICLGQSYTIIPDIKDGNPFLYQYKWNGKDTMANSKNLKIKPDTSGRYFFKLNDQNCTPGQIYDSIDVIVRKALQINASNDTTICYGTSAILNVNSKGGNGKYTFSWNNGLKNGTSQVVSPLLTTSYIVTLTDSCSSAILSDTVVVKVLPALSDKLTTKDDTLCLGQTTVLKVVPLGGKGTDYKIEWDNSSTDSITIVNPNFSKYYMVKITDGCTNPSILDSIKINVWSLPKIKAAPDTTLCFGQDHIFSFISSGGRNGTIKTWWEFNKALISNPVTLDPMTAGTFNYIAVIKDGCQFSERDTTTINVLEKLDINPKNIQKCSPQDSLILFKTSGGKLIKTQLTWLDGTQGFSKSFNAKASKIYTVILSDGCSDTAMYDISAVVDEFGNNDFTIFSVIDKTVTLKAGIPLQKVDWNFGDGIHNSSDDTVVEKIFSDYGSYVICRKQTDRIGCVNVVCKNVDVINVMKNEWFTMAVKPNPNTGKFNLEFNKIPGNLKVEVFDGLGQALFSQSSLNYVGTNFAIDIGSVAGGFYILKVTMNDEVINRRIIVK
ncbi:MAG: S8 family serine peptidase [Bacteroidia bacterium]